MQVNSIGATTDKAPAPSAFLGRLVQLLQQNLAKATPSNWPEQEVGGVATTLTLETLRATLMAMGAKTDALNMTLAASFAQLGLSLTPQTLTEAHNALARSPLATPLAYALARSLELPTTPDALRALATVTDGFPLERTLPADLMDLLSFSIDLENEPDILAAQLHLRAAQSGRSTENRILAAMIEKKAPADIRDARTVLLTLAQASSDKAIRRSADLLAAHLEGQQMINQAATRAHESQAEMPIYLAVPLHFAGEQMLAEMRLWNWEEPKDESEEDEETPFLRATVRIETKRLGKVQADLAGTRDGRLTCRLGAERPGTARLLHQYTSILTESLANLGWPQCEVACQRKTDFAPLWHGGEALTAPRARIDWRA